MSTPWWVWFGAGMIVGWGVQLAFFVALIAWSPSRRNIPPGPLCTAGPPYESELVEPQDRCQARSAEAGHHCTLDATHTGAHLCGAGCGRGWVL